MVIDGEDLGDFIMFHMYTLAFAVGFRDDDQSSKFLAHAKVGLAKPYFVAFCLRAQN